MNSLAESQQNVELTCSYCQEYNIIPILLNQDNYFECTKCGETNAVILQYATARRTSPLYAKPVTLDEVEAPEKPIPPPPRRLKEDEDHPKQPKPTKEDK